jgi:hypothetical protein
MKTDEQRRARELRGLGWSIGEIERELNVSRSSVSLWVRSVELSQEAERRLLRRAGLGPLNSASRSIARARAIRADLQADGRLRARVGDASYAVGCVLHWAEGDKTRNSVRIANSDPELLALFVEFLRIHFGVRNDQITIYCNLFADHIERQVEIETFWLTKLGLPPTALRKSVINNYSKHSKKKRKNKLPWGTCKVCVHSSRIQQTILGSIQEYGGFERPEWLD